jgi:peroxiredoxin
MPSMERARKKLEGEDIVILAINVGEDEDTIFTFTGNYPVQFPLIMDKDEKTIKSYPVTGLPTTYIIDPQGNVTHRVIGSREWDDDVLLNKLRELLHTKQ